jgi:hypothetical protein
MKNTILIFLVFCTFLSSKIVSAEAEIEDPTEEELAAQMQIEKEDRRRQAREKRATMESCLTLVRSEYYHNKNQAEAFVNEHPTQDKNTLTSKIVARMMIQCKSAISMDQVNFIQGFKLDSNSLNILAKPEL